MKDYKKIPFNQIEDIKSYAEKMLKSGHIIIQILVNEDKKEIEELISYANDKECKSYFRSLTDSDEQLKCNVIVETLEPYYGFKDTNNNDNNVSTDTIDIEVDTQNVIDFKTFKEDFANCKKEYHNGESFKDDDKMMKHYEFFISVDGGDIANFGGCTELNFILTWMQERGYFNL